MSLAVVDVLVVDDNEDLLELASRMLQRASFSVATAKDFDQLELRLGDIRPRLILMDVQMPDLFGDEVANVLRNVRGIQAKIYLYSSLDPDQLTKLVGNARLDGWIAKSDGIAHLVEEVRRLLR
jgi:DNA-binding response OmpR family regulator